MTLTSHRIREKRRVTWHRFTAAVPPSRRSNRLVRLFRTLTVAGLLVVSSAAAGAQEIASSLRSPGVAAPGDSVRLWLEGTSLTGRFLGFRADSVAFRRHDRDLAFGFDAIDGLDVRAREPVLFFLAGGIGGGVLALLTRNLGSPTAFFDSFLCPLCEHNEEKPPAATALINGFLIGGSVAVTYNFLNPSFVPRFRRPRR